MKKFVYSMLLLALAANGPAFAKNGLRVFDGNGCSGDGGNCLPDVIVTPKSTFKPLIAALDKAVSAGTTGEFFSSPMALELFPILEKHPEKLEILRNGLTVHRVDRPNGMTFYIATELNKKDLVAHINRRRVAAIADQIELCMPIRNRPR